MQAMYHLYSLHVMQAAKQGKECLSFPDVYGNYKMCVAATRHGDMSSCYCPGRMIKTD